MRATRPGTGRFLVLPASLRLVAVIAGLLCLSASACARSQTGRFVDRVYKDAAGEHKYVVFLPAGYEAHADKKWPAILFLHGAGERGTDGRKQLTAGLGPFVKHRSARFPFVVVFPQSHAGERYLTGWLAESPDGKRALQILAQVEQDYRIDAKRRILTGWSMGGYGAWSLAAAHPKLFSAVVPLAGGGDEAWAAKLKDVPIWAFHGEDDLAIRPSESRKMIRAIRGAGGKPRFALVPSTGHEVWKVVYGHDELYRWMLDPRSAGRGDSRIRFGATPALQKELEADQPFVPALIARRAMFLRIGNDALDAAGEALPQMLPADAMTGTIPDIQDSTVQAGRPFNIYFSQIGYRAELARTEVYTADDERLHVRVGLRNAVMQIGYTTVVGRKRSAAAGPIQIVIGHRYPVWMNLTLEPFVDRTPQEPKLRFKIVERNLQIPDDNWYVGAPAWVATRGWFMTRGRVTRGLISGLYGSKSRIEREALSAADAMVARLEDQLDLSILAKSASNVWPLPVYHPRMQVWPDEVSVDANGLTLLLGMTVAAIDPAHAPASPRQLQPFPRPSAELRNARKLHVGVAPALVEPLTQMLIDAGVARVHVLDVPEPKFAAFVDREQMTQAIPDLRRYGQNLLLRAELILMKPLEVGGEETPVDSAGVGASATYATEPGPRPLLRTSQLRIAVSIKTSPDEAAWTPLANIDYALSQRAAIDVKRVGFAGRRLTMQWTGAPRIKTTASFVAGYEPADATFDLPALEAMMRSGWNAWTRRGPSGSAQVADIEFGTSRYRLDSSGWTPPFLGVEFAEPGVQVSNESQQPLAYEARGPQTGWGGPYRLEPGESHTFPVAYPMTYRRRLENGGYRTFTLPAGSHSQFRASPTGGAQLYNVAP